MIIYRKVHRVLVQGITGKQGTFWTEKMIECGTRVVAGVNPKRAGESHIGVPAVSYTHLDVYKRQARSASQLCQGGRRLRA